jgi:predicted unusual protein kinase regulating ubiquinone biosynthesis (AarF/ABC1/UbiB family)
VIDGDLTEQPVAAAAASLGQVYKAMSKGTTQEIAIKVQRPVIIEYWTCICY